MQTAWGRIFAVLGVLAVYAAVTATPVRAGDPEVVAELSGFGVAFNSHFVITATRLSSGEVQGIVIDAGSFAGEVVELVPPSLVTDFWCVSVVVEDIVGVSGGPDWLIFVKDNPGGGPDELSFARGENLECADVLVPTRPFEEVIGDFVGVVK